MKNFHEFFLENYSSLLIGHLIHGIVHNCNGPLQALTMLSDMNKIEFEKYIANSKEIDEKFKEKFKKKLDNFDSELAKLKDLAVTLSRKKGENLKKPLLLRDIIDYQIKFWRGDLFYKHQVKTSLELPEKDVYVMVEESEFLKLLDSIFLIQIENLKKAKNNGYHDLQLIISYFENLENKQRIITFNNNCIEIKWLDTTDSIDLETLSFYILRETQKRLNIEVTLTGTEFKIILPSK